MTSLAGVVELADTLGLGPSESDLVGVQVPLSAPFEMDWEKVYTEAKWLILALQWGMSPELAVAHFQRLGYEAEDSNRIVAVAKGLNYCGR